jgi:hypothetical protein
MAYEKIMGRPHPDLRKHRLKVANDVSGGVQKQHTVGSTESKESEKKITPPKKIRIFFSKKQSKKSKKILTKILKILKKILKNLKN